MGSSPSGCLAHAASATASTTWGVPTACGAAAASCRGWKSVYQRRRSLKPSDSWPSTPFEAKRGPCLEFSQSVSRVWGLYYSLLATHSFRDRARFMFRIWLDPKSQPWLYSLLATRSFRNGERFMLGIWLDMNKSWPVWGLNSLQNTGHRLWDFRT